ncbi:MAG TPA: hypothetical protein VF941_15170, partial [Clostridia bacterium]
LTYIMQETRSSPEIPDEKYLISLAINAYINESEDLYLKFGKNQKCSDVKDLFENLIFNQPRLNNKTYGPYMDMKYINKAISDKRLDSFLRNEEMREKGLWWKIIIDVKKGSCSVEYSDKNEILYVGGKE